MSIDRNGRRRLAAEMRRFLAGEISAFAFDEAVSGIQDATYDETVRQIV